MTRRARIVAALVAAVAATAIALAAPAGAVASITSSINIGSDARASLDLTIPPLVSAQLELPVPSGHPAGYGTDLGNVQYRRADAPLSGYGFYALSTGDVAATGAAPSTNNGVGPVNGTAYDVADLSLQLTTPDGANCMGIDANFLTNDVPEGAGEEGAYLDGAFARLEGAGGWTIAAADSDVTQPVTPLASSFMHFNGQMLTGRALTDGNNAIAVPYGDANHIGGTPFTAASGWFTTATPITAGAHTLDVVLFDRGDATKDSMLLLDDLQYANRAPGTCIDGSEDFTAPVPAITSPTGLRETAAATIGGTSDQDGTVTVSVYAGSAATGAPAATFDATATGGVWSGAPAALLAHGDYTAVAEQTDAVGNIGDSAPVTFTIAVDRCPNLAGAQATIPAGLTLTAGSCVDSTPPALTIVSLKSSLARHKLLGSGLSFTLGTGEAHARISASLTAPASALRRASHTRTLGSVSAATSAAGNITLHLHLTHAGAAALRAAHAHRVHATLSITVRDQAGNARTLHRTITIHR